MMEDKLPSFSDSVSTIQNLDLPPPYTSSLSLSLLPSTHSFPSQSLRMTGESRSPDFEVVSTSPNQQLFRIETDSTHVHHETSVHTVHPTFRLFNMKRKREDDQWMYTAHTPGSVNNSVKLFEISTTSELFTSGSPKVRLVFRNSSTTELDALYLQAPCRSSNGYFTVQYRDEDIGTILNTGGDRAPEYALRINVPGIDPLLFIVFALVIDDRLMSTRRRVRRPLGSGWKGIGRGPGAGLALAYGLGGI